MQGDAFAVKAAFCRREDALRLCKMQKKQNGKL